MENFSLLIHNPKNMRKIPKFLEESLSLKITQKFNFWKILCITFFLSKVNMVMLIKCNFIFIYYSLKRLKISEDI